MALPAAAAAQIHHLAELPWHVTAADGGRRGVELSWQQDLDSSSHWRADRFGLSVRVPLGARGLFFLSGDYLRFDTAALPARQRWPRLEPTGQDAPANPDSNWPGEAIINGFGRPELGLIFPFVLPLAGQGMLGLRAGLPIGTDRLYPLSCACLPLSCDWRAARILRGRWQAAVRVGLEHTFASAGDELSDQAFPGGWRYGGELGQEETRERGFCLSWSARELAGGRHGRSLALSGWLPLGEGHQLRLQVARDCGDRADRFAQWSMRLSWHLAGLPPSDKQIEMPARQNADREFPPEEP